MNVLTQADVQDKYRVSRQTVYDWRKNRGLPFKKFGDVLMFEAEAVEEWYKQYKNKK